MKGFILTRVRPRPPRNRCHQPSTPNCTPTQSLRQLRRTLQIARADASDWESCGVVACCAAVLSIAVARFAWRSALRTCEREASRAVLGVGVDALGLPLLYNVAFAFLPSGHTYENSQRISRLRIFCERSP